MENVWKLIAALVVSLLVMTLGVVLALVVFATPGHALADTTYAAAVGTVHGHH